MSLFSSAVILAAAVLFMTGRFSSESGPPSSGTAPYEPAAADFTKEGWIDDNTFRVRVERPSMFPEFGDQEQRKKLMRDAVNGSYFFDLIDGLTAGYYQQLGLDPAPESREKVFNTLDTFIGTIQPVLLSETFNEEVTAIESVIEISREGLHDTVDGLIKRELSGGNE
jgi:hypothetical protein